MDLINKNVLVFGTGISGIGAAVLLEKIQAKPILYDENDNIKIEEVRDRLPGESKAEIIIGKLPDSIIERLDLVILSPGVPTDLPLVQRIRKTKVPIWGEVELAYANSKGCVLAITGTNGKTTTTSLLGEILKHHQESVFIVGNIGTPYTQAVLNMTKDSVTVAEISSFQLETINTFRPKVSAILNITPDHLNRHHTMEEYIKVKENIAKNQTGNDVCVLNYEDEILREFGKTLRAQVLFFSSMRTLDKGIYLNGSIIEYNDGETITVICDTKELKLPGRHNHENVMAAAAMALVYGVPPEEVRFAVKRFTAVEHRIEYVKTVNGVDYYNDSKGTNPDAAIKGIQAMDRPTLLIGGGYDKDSDYEEWIRSFKGKVKYLILIGETREKIAKAAKKCGFTDIVLADTLEEAVHICAGRAAINDAVLLSPACASWDMFPSYEVRGQMFKEYVGKL